MKLLSTETMKITRYRGGVTAYFISSYKLEFSQHLVGVKNNGGSLRHTKLALEAALLFSA
ncbi:hypothetical protein GCM10027217_34710 [Pseudomaricurvus hydrocarbonicus]